MKPILAVCHALVFGLLLASQLLGPSWAVTYEQVNTTSAQTLTNKTLTAPAIASPVLSGTATGTYTLAGTGTLSSPTINTPSIASPVLSGTTTGTYTLAGTGTLSSPTINTPSIASPVLSGTTTGTYTLAGTPTITSPTISSPVLSGTTTGTYTLGGTGTLSSPILSGTTTGTYTIGGTPQLGNGSILPYVPGVKWGTSATTLPMISQDVAGQTGRRLSIEGTGTGGAEIQLVPGSGATPASQITSQIIWVNKPGTDLERFTISAINNAYIIDSTTNNAGVVRNIAFQMGGQVLPSVIAGQNAIQLFSDASVDLLGATYTLSGRTWGTTRTRLVDPTNTGDTRLVLDTRTGTPTSNTADDAMLDIRRGGVSKWFAGLNANASNNDSFEIVNTTASQNVFRLYPDMGIQIKGGISAGSIQSKNLTGQCSFSAATTCAVTFTNTEVDINYRIAMSCNANKTFWYSAKATTGFTINASSSSSDNCDWIIAR